MKTMKVKTYTTVITAAGIRENDGQPQIVTISRAGKYGEREAKRAVKETTFENVKALTYVAHSAAPTAYNVDADVLLRFLTENGTIAAPDSDEEPADE